MDLNEGDPDDKWTDDYRIAVAAAEQLMGEAGDLGSARALAFLALLRFEAGDPVDGRQLAIRAVNFARPEILTIYADLIERWQDPAEAERVRRYGLTIDGTTATGMRPGFPE
ncbi:hypothetical protein [Actinoplanes sp. NPDC049118]|uniref:hypothetical protein n=1 Tax=Actinoplanes sp. NPDC049118 TaxID=3155769 RepID=UPI0033EE83A7